MGFFWNGGFIGMGFLLSLGLTVTTEGKLFWEPGCACCGMSCGTVGSNLPPCFIFLKKGFKKVDPPLYPICIFNNKLLVWKSYKSLAGGQWRKLTPLIVCVPCKPLDLKYWESRKSMVLQVPAQWRYMRRGGVS